MPNFNSKIIAESVSVINQTLRLELIIDDNSSDKVEILKNSKSDDRITLIKLKKNFGPGLQSQGLKLLKKIHNIYNSDDLWDLNKLETQILIMEKLSLAITHTDYGYINSNGKISSKLLKLLILKLV